MPYLNIETIYEFETNDRKPDSYQVRGHWDCQVFNVVLHDQVGREAKRVFNLYQKKVPSYPYSGMQIVSRIEPRAGWYPVTMALYEETEVSQ